MDDLLGNERAARATIVGQQQELDGYRQKVLTLQGHAIDIEHATAALLSEIHNR